MHSNTTSFLVIWWKRYSVMSVWLWIDSKKDKHPLLALAGIVVNCWRVSVGTQEHFQTLKFLSPTNAPPYYTYKMLKCTVKVSHDRSDKFRSTWTIIREPMPNLAKVTIGNATLLCQYDYESTARRTSIRCLHLQVLWLTANCGKNASLYVQQCCGKKCFKLWCVNTYHSLKHFLPQHCWTYNAFLLIISTKL